jgi:hypothetical protein
VDLGRLDIDTLDAVGDGTFTIEATAGHADIYGHAAGVEYDFVALGLAATDGHAVTDLG